jgi:MFS family permease
MEATMAMPATGSQNPLAVLGNAQYRLLFVGNVLSMLAFGMMQVVQGVVAFDLTGRNSAVGFVFLGQGISMLILSPIGGTLSDRISKKRLLTVSQFIIGAIFGAIAVLIATGWITILFLAGATLVLGCMYSIMGPTRQAWTGDLLEGPDLASGIALQQLMMNTTRIVGPLLAGALIAAEPIGTAGTYFTMAGLFGGVVVFLALMDPTPPRPRANPTSVRSDLTEGFRYIWHAPDVRLLAFVFVGIVLSGFSYQTIMPGYIENTLDRPASHLGLLFGAAAIGGIIVTLALASRRVRNPAVVMLAFGATLAISLALLAIAPGFELALIIAVLVGAASSGFQMLNNVNLMERTDRAYFGRVMAVTMMAFGANSIVAYPIGLIADQIGERVTLIALASVCLLVVSAGAIAMRAAPKRSSTTTVPSESGVPTR